MPSPTDTDRMRAAVARLAEASASLAELLLAPSGARTAPGAATSVAASIASGPLMAGAGAVSAPEAPGKDTREVVFSAPSQRPRVLGLDEGEARLLLANALAVLEHARPRIHSSRRPQLEAVAQQIRTALDGQRGRTRSHGPPDSGDVAVAA